jgi:mRNA interferase HicA
MKRRQLEKCLSELGWWFVSHGGAHDHWTNGKICESVPRHSEINENLARKIIKTARNNPPEREKQ